MDRHLARVPIVRILWADEGGNQAQSVREVLAGEFQVHVEHDAERALACAREQSLALICVGISLQTRDGIPLVRALRGQPASAQTVLLLMCPRRDELEYPGELFAYADDLLLTPFSDRELIMRLRAHARAASALGAGADVFLHGIDHELRTPLTAIQLWASSLRDGAVEEAELARALRAISASAQGQARRIDDLLDMARLARGALGLQRSSASVAALLQDVWDEAEPLAAAKQVEIELSQAEPLGSIEADSRRMRQVLSNLLANAIKYTAEQGRVTLRASRHEGAIAFEVSDTGKGLAPERMQQLFEPSRPHGMVAPGLGIGLVLSRRLVELHGGSLEVRSAGPDGGASFRVLLPQLRATPMSDAKAQSRSAEKRTLNGRRVLLVEDHDETREAMQFVLERAGAQVLVAGSGRRGLELLGAGPEQTGEWFRAVDAVVCDLGLPDMNGYEFIASLVQACQRRHLSPPPACALSAHAREADRRRAIQAGFDLHIAKPLNADALIEAVDDLCQVTAARVSKSPSEQVSSDESSRAEH